MNNNKPDIKIAEEIAKKVLKNNKKDTSNKEEGHLRKEESHLSKGQEADQIKSAVLGQDFSKGSQDSNIETHIKGEKKQNQTRQSDSDSASTNEESQTLSYDNLVLENQDLKTKYSKLKENHLRSLSDLENTRKRLQKDKIEAVKYSPSDIIKDFFTIYDNLSLALQSISATKQNLDTIKSLTTGVEMTRNEMISIFSRHNIEIISPKRGEEFDWDFHLAGGTISDDDLPDGSVSKTLSVGVLFHDRLLRPATVLVCKNEGKKDPNDKNSKVDKKQTSHVDKTI